MSAQQTGCCTCYLLRPGDPDNTTFRGEGGFVSGGVGVNEQGYEITQEDIGSGSGGVHTFHLNSPACI